MKALISIHRISVTFSACAIGLRINHCSPRLIEGNNFIRRPIGLTRKNKGQLFRPTKPKVFCTMPFYAVARGKSPGIFKSWPECQEQIVGFKAAVYKKFATIEEAEEFVKERGSLIIDKRNKGEKSTKSGSSESNNSSNNESESSGVKRKHDSTADVIQPKKTKLIENDLGKFTVNEDGFLVLYTDGSCQFNGKKGALGGIGVFFGPNHPMNVSEPVKGKATNNVAEIQAAVYAAELTKAAGFDKVVINTDSQFMINCVTSWMKNWKKNGWKKSDGSDVKNKEDLIDLDKAGEGLLIKWNHVKGHSSIEGNEAADRLARDGAKKYVAQEMKEK